MCLRKGEPAEGLDFYSLLCQDDDFCKELGRVVLAAGRLESGLRQLVINSGLNKNISRFTLGQLITLVKERNLLPASELPAFEILTIQRNCLTHNIHALLSGLIEETILEGSNLLDSDVDVFTERAWQLTDNLNGLAEVLEGQRT